MPDSSDNVNSGARASGTIDWSRPIEAVHEDGRVGTVEPIRIAASGPGGYYAGLVKCGSLAAKLMFRKDGSPTDIYDCYGWRIRNVQPTTPEFDPALWDRMVALVRRMSAPKWRDNDTITEHYREAQAIVAHLPKPVDPDEEIARGLVRAAYPEMKPGYAGRRYQIALAAIKRGRELATPEVSHAG